jgi:ankyrin repeat protein
MAIIVFCSIALPISTSVRFSGDRLRYNAARFNHRTILKALLLFGGMKQDYLDEALVDSTSGSDPVMVAYLLAHGANPSSKLLKDDTALMLASQRNSSEITKLLLRAGAQIDTQDSDGMTALMWAAKTNAVEPAKALIAAGARLNMRNKRGESALDIAHQFHFDQIAQVIITAQSTKGQES